MKLKNNSSKDKFPYDLDKVYHFLSLRPRSEKEIIDYFKKRKISPQSQEKIFKLLKEQKLVDDLAFVEWWIDQRATFRPKGKIALRVELKQKGVQEKIIEEVIKKINEVELAKRAIVKKNKIYHGLSPKERSLKITHFLLSRGFSWPTIKEIVSCENS